jgi:hypothetical protein
VDVQTFAVNFIEALPVCERLVFYTANELGRAAETGASAKPEKAETVAADLSLPRRFAGAAGPPYIWEPRGRHCDAGRELVAAECSLIRRPA